MPPTSATASKQNNEMINIGTSRVTQGHRPEKLVLPAVGEAHISLDDAFFDAGERVSHPINFPASSFKYRFVKRGIELGFVVLSLPLLLPLILMIAVLVRFSTAGPIFFSQPRVHNKRKFFRILKFRTMSANAEAILREHLANDISARIEWRDTHKLRFDPRVSRIGSWLRRYSLDELPQIWNVVKGDMSLIGPRPISKAEIAKYGSHFACYRRVKPGLTGLWQVSGRNQTTYTQRVLLDCDYVRHWSLSLDLKILLRSFRTVISSHGAF